MTAADQFGAGPSLLGYLYQCRVALLLTLRKTRRDPGLQVSIERFDDVSFDDGESPLERIQTKHHVQKPGSLSDRSSDLWKTLRIWVDGITRGSLDPSTTILTLLTTSNASTGSAASYLRHDGRDESLALRILEEIAIDGKAQPKHENFSAYVVFDALSRRDRSRLLQSIYVVDASPQISEVRLKIEDEVHYAVLPKHQAGFVDRLEGWWFRKVIIHLSGASISPIFGQEVEAEVEYIREQYQAENLTIDFFEAEPPEGVDASADRRVFVEQLRLIAVSNPRIADAIRDYYRAYQQRSLWLREDQLVLDELERYESRLIDEWRRYRDQLIEDLPNTASEPERVRAGKELFNWMHSAADIPIRSQCREPYVQRGSFHILADDRKVGWHPDFLERLQKLLTTASSPQ
jgi:hypothetical protein